MRHIWALTALVGLTALFLGAAGWIMSKAAVDEQRVTVLFPPGFGGGQVLAAVAAADGSIIRETILPGGIEAISRQQGFSERLKSQGAWLVLPPLPAHALALGGCSFLPMTAYEDRPAVRKALSGPM